MRNPALFASIVFSSLFIAGAVEAADGYVTDSSGAVVRSGNGLCWKTGYWTPGMATAECDPDLAPKPKAAEKPAAKASAPAPAPLAAKPATETTTLAADGLFAFGKATLLPKGKRKLDEVIGKIQGRSADQILVIGHTDRIGSQKANQRLSQKRAEAVKAYLVARKVDKNLIRVEGKGSSEPVTTAGQCPGKGGAKVIACLAPDRRVEIRVSGLK
jgi:OOP family OmpA-OmpF porin